MMNNIPTIPICFVTAGAAVLYAIIKYSSTVDTTARKALPCALEEEYKNLSTQLITQKSTMSELESRIEVLMSELANEKNERAREVSGLKLKLEDLKLQRENELLKHATSLEEERSRRAHLQTDYNALLQQFKTFMKEIDKARNEQLA